jgi:hypothetical protein
LGTFVNEYFDKEMTHIRQQYIALLLQALVSASALHLFNNGLALQKRYIFSVIQKRIPSDAFFTGNTGNGNMNQNGNMGMGISLLNKF